ncbi:2880_t:CDS:2 [Diversispora eburnea]|uniref:2880_t:CDS:1 n=1 Tax=Diversispora eburnea TaxID=1213867 RepID=A0A9N8VGG7_9GLOM|nr:2880_t:CDS:2 [Diversispora eburnea]
MASDFPNSTFIGVDISPIFPASIKPHNVNFCQLNVITNGLLAFESNTFDFVYIRFMNLALMENQWSELLQELIRVCKPGGWIECMEGDLQFDNEDFEKEHKSTPIGKWGGRVGELAKENIIALSKSLKPILQPILNNWIIDNNESNDETFNIEKKMSIYNNDEFVTESGELDKNNRRFRSSNQINMFGLKSKNEIRYSNESSTLGTRYF